MARPGTQEHGEEAGMRFVRRKAIVMTSHPFTRPGRRPITRARWLVGLAVVVAALAAGEGQASAKCGRHERKCCGKYGACKPRIESVSASKIGEHSVTLEAVIAPEIPAKYEAWISYAPCQGGAGECPKPVQTETVGHGTVFGSRTVHQKVRMLTPGCTYVYWFVATNYEGKAESAHESFTAAGGTSGPKECSR